MFIFIGAVVPTQGIENEYYNLFPHVDKIVHFSLYSIFAFLAYTAYSNNEKFEFLVTVLILAYAILVESLHLIIPYRAFEWEDIFANTVGALLGIFFAFLVFNRGIIRK
jgi:VanZ family protein